jgi:SAM-dependent methyltransferase
MKFTKKDIIAWEKVYKDGVQIRYSVEMREFIAEPFKDLRGGSYVVDVGSGPGADIAAVEALVGKKFKIFLVDVVDIPPVEKRYIKIIDYAEKLNTYFNEYEQGYFDAALCSFILEYGDKDKITENVHKVLRPGAFAVFLCHAKNSFEMRLASIQYGIWKRFRDYLKVATDLLDKRASREDYLKVFRRLHAIAPKTAEKYDNVIKEAWRNPETLHIYFSEKLRELSIAVDLAMTKKRANKNSFERLEELKKFMSAHGFEVLRSRSFIERKGLVRVLKEPFLEPVLVVPKKRGELDAFGVVVRKKCEASKVENEL